MCLSAGIIHVLYYIIFFSRLSINRQNTKQKPQINNTAIPISVILCAKNEESKLFHSVEAIASQDYPDFEIILIDDHSIDNTLSIMEKLTKYYNFVHFFSAPDKIKASLGKKAALSYGISKAKHNTLLLTDADCIPNSDQWIQGMANKLLDKDIVLGYGPTLKKKGLWNAFFQFETFLTAVQYFSYALAKLPYMGVGRNLMYKKELFEKKSGFKGHAGIASGDDDLFIQDHADHNNTSICISKETFMKSSGPESLHAFFRQKLRHSSTSYSYQMKHKVLLFIFAVTHLLFYISIFPLFFSSFKIAFIIYGTWIVIRWLILTPIMKKFEENNLIVLFPVLDFIFAVYILIMALLSPFYKANQWK